tara:strand:+ start:2248 stop:3144 length:897 start_codon:yes stop_codon:yes gene_type:complete
MTENKSSELQLEFKEPSQAVEIHTAFRCPGLSVQYSRLKLPAEYDFKWDGSSHYLAYHDLILVDGEMEVAGENRIVGRDLTDKMTYVPIGQTIDGWGKPADRLNAFTVVCFDPVAMEAELEAEFSSFDPRAKIYFKNEELGATMRKLGRLMADQEKPVSKIYAETLGLTAALEMFRISNEETEIACKIVSGQLSKSQRDMVVCFIEDNLAKDIGLDELASVCGLTRFHFSRAFKASFGVPPYHYLNQRRIDRARQMLVGTGFPIASIAEACGFNGASQFGRSFRSAVGQTPLAFRRSN